jgi:hypothetical protein
VNASTFVPKFLQIYNKGVYFKELMVRRRRSMCGNIYKKCTPPHSTPPHPTPPHPLKTTSTIPGIPCYLCQQGQNVTPLNFGTDPISVQGWQVRVYTPKCMISWFGVQDAFFFHSSRFCFPLFQGSSSFFHFLILPLSFTSLLLEIILFFLRRYIAFFCIFMIQSFRI